MYNYKQYGFTIVELLIVIVVIGILAAIVIVAYNGVQNRATNTSIQSDLKNMVKKLELYKVDYARYPLTEAELLTADISVSKSSYDITANNLLYCKDAGGTAYAIVAKSKSTTTYTISNTSSAAVELPAGLGSQTVTCPALGLPGTGNIWGRDVGVWRPWTKP